MQTGAQKVGRYRGEWRGGSVYEASDVVSRGRWGFRSRKQHVAGEQSEPNHGAHWAQFWEPVDGFADGAAATPPVAVAPQQNGASIHVLPVPYLPAPAAAPSLPAAVAPSVAPAPPATAGPVRGGLPAEPRAASEIVDDSDSGGMSVAFALDAMRKSLEHSVRREELGALLDKLVRLEARIEAIGAPEIEDPLTAEAWRRRRDLLAAPTRSEAERQIFDMTREYVRLLRKRDKGQALSAQEAARFAVLDYYDQVLDAIDQAERAMRDIEPPDVTADRHWPAIGSAA